MTAIGSAHAADEGVLNRIKKYKMVISAFILLFLGIAMIILGVSLRVYSELAFTMLRDLGFVFTPLGLVVLGYEYAAKEEHITQLASALTERFDIRLRGTSGQNQVKSIHSSRMGVMTTAFSEATRNVDILATNLDWLTGHLGALLALAKRRVHVRILTLDPMHEFVLRRAPELNIEPKRFHQEMITSLRTFCQARDDLKSRAELPSVEGRDCLEIRTYHNTPALMMFRVDRRVIIGFILQLHKGSENRGRNNIHVEFQDPSAVCSFECSKASCDGMSCKTFIDHFETIWGEAHEITVCDLDQMKWSRDTVVRGIPR